MPRSKAKKIKLLTDPQKLKFEEDIKRKNLMISATEKLLGKKNAEIKSLKRRLEALNGQVKAMKVADLKEKLELTEALLKRRADWIETKNRELNVYRSVIDECKRCTRSYAKRWMVLEGLKVEFPAVSTD